MRLKPGNRGRWTALLLVVAVVAACAEAGTPPPAGPAQTAEPQTIPQPHQTADPCEVAVKHLGVFAERMAGELAALRPLVTATRFDSAATAGAIRQVAATLTAFATLEGRLAHCDAADGAAAQVEELRSSAQVALAKVQSARVLDARAQRRGAAALLELLPAALELSGAAQALAEATGVDVAVADIPDGSAEPITSLPPLATQPPAPTPRPAPTPTTVRLPRLSERIAGAAAIRYFAVKGDSPNDLTTSTVKSSRQFCGKHALACVHLDSRIRWSYVANPWTGSCTIQRVRIVRSYTVYLPRWTKPDRVHPTLLTWWRKMLDHMAWHEGQHIRIQNAHVAKMRAALQGKPCGRARTIVDRWSARARAAHDAFDRRDRAWPYPTYAGPGGWFGT